MFGCGADSECSTWYRSTDKLSPPFCPRQQHLSCDLTTSTCRQELKCSPVHKYLCAAIQSVLAHSSADTKILRCGYRRPPSRPSGPVPLDVFYKSTPITQLVSTAPRRHVVSRTKTSPPQALHPNDTPPSVHLSCGNITCFQQFRTLFDVIQ